MYWLDYSAAELSGTIVKNAGYTGAIRYIDSPANLGRKHTSLAEYRSLVAAGLGVRLVMQTTTTASDGGRAVGVDHAQRAKAGADYLGYGGVIYFTNDRTTVPDPAAWAAYLSGAASVLGWARVGAYGFANAMDIARDRTACVHFWQAGRRSDVRAFVQVWQDNNTQVTVGGITCDRNLILKPLTEENEVELTDAFNETAQKPGTVGHTLLNVKQNAAAARAYVDTLEPKVTGLQSEVAAVKAIETENQRRIGQLKDEVLAAVAASQGTGGVNVDALAAQVAAQLGPVIGQVVADEVARRLAN
jgi:hypothetical protein